MKYGVFRSESGQTQILGVMVLTTAMLTGGLFALEYASRSQVAVIGQTRGVEMRMALESGARSIQQLWRSSAGCDRVVFNEMLNRMKPDGTLAPGDCATTDNCRRQLEVTVNRRNYRIAFGPIDPARDATGSTNWESSLSSDQQPYPDGGTEGNPGIPQDILLEMWTQWGGTASGVPGRRTVQRIVLINDCAPTCMGITSPTSSPSVITPPDSSSGDPICLARDVAVDYGAIVSPSLYPSATLPASSLGSTVSYTDGSRKCSSAVGAVATDRRRGDANSTSEGAVDVLDLRSMLGFLRQYDTTRTVVAPPSASPSATANNCGDLDGDDRVTEIDAGILEKALRGYLLWLPVSF